jgi:hypothetical protein
MMGRYGLSRGQHHAREREQEENRPDPDRERKSGQCYNKQGNDYLCYKHGAGETDDEQESQHDEDKELSGDVSFHEMTPQAT